MIVADDDRGRVQRKCSLRDDSRVYLSTVNGAVEKFFKREEAVPCIQECGGKYLVLTSTESRCKE
jgi:hypothetical protein